MHGKDLKGEIKDATQYSPKTAFQGNPRFRGRLSGFRNRISST
jgi:hypothetical protein